MARQNAIDAGKQTYKDLGLKLVCKFCPFEPEPDAIVYECSRGYKSICHFIKPGCPKAGKKRRQWSIASENWLPQPE